VADDRRNNTSSHVASLAATYTNIAVSSSSYGRVRRTMITRGKFYLPMTSRTFELCAKKKRWRTARRDSIKAERRHDAMEHHRRRRYHYCRTDGARRQRRRHRRSGES